MRRSRQEIRARVGVSEVTRLKDLSEIIREKRD